MRRHAALALCLISVVCSGCMSLNPDSKLNVNRGEYRDEWNVVGAERNADQEPEKEPDGLGKWLYSPKARAIFKSTGSDQ
jgi:hypothetical protein